MSCDIAKGRLKSCKDSVGGTSSLFLFNEVADPFTVVDGIITGINPLLTEVFEFELIGDGNPFTEDKPSDRNTQTSISTQTITALLGKLDGDTSNTMNLLTAGYPMAVVKDNNNNYMGVGLDDGIDFQVAPTTGGAKTDFNGYTLTGVSTTKELAPFMDETTRDAFLALVVAPV